MSVSDCTPVTPDTPVTIAIDVTPVTYTLDTTVTPDASDQGCFLLYVDYASAWGPAPLRGPSSCKSGLNICGVT